MSKESAAQPAGVNFTRPEKVFFSGNGFRKGDVIAYYLKAAPFILPHLKNRPVTLIRFPDGAGGEHFYEKNAPRYRPKWLKTAPVRRSGDGGTIDYILINDVRSLAWCVNLAAIELHPFLHRAPKIHRPTLIAFDLDPGEGATILTCVDVAFWVKEVLDGLGLKSFPKVSGSKGVQVYVPLNNPAATYAMTGGFAHAVADLLTQQHPDRVVSRMPKVLRKDKVLVDWSQNSEMKTTVCVYAMRAKRDEPFISVPVAWEELRKARKPEQLFFSPDEALARMKKLGDLFAPVQTLKQKLPKGFSAAPALSEYSRKRDFTRTAEPPPKVERGPAGPERNFVIQKHAASHLHYDFRLEMDGTLKSWAVPKGLPYEPGVKRSAFAVEDHPLNYMRFEGTIPQGQYGGGTVMVWDIGTYRVTKGDYGSGRLHLELKGRKLKGAWRMFKIRSQEGKDVWLIEKEGGAMKPLTPRQEDASVLTRRSMARIAKDNDAQWDSSRR